MSNNKRKTGDPVLDMESIMIPPDPTKKIYTQIVGKVFDLYLSGEIKSPEEYSDWFQVIRSAGPEDVIRLHINSPGGDLLTTVQFLTAMGESQANILCFVEGYCMSAATMIFLAGQYYIIADHSVFMFHNYSGGTFGKGGEMFDNITHERIWSTAMMKKVYEHFLSPEEIDAMMNNKDLWMDKEEVVKRLEIRNAILAEKLEKEKEAEDGDVKEEVTGEVEVKPKTRKRKVTPKKEKEDVSGN
mgnify:CR=1 FL=1|jgi:ATP-dependent protease ClpP protease subunit